MLVTKKIEITADAPQIPVGVDGEAVSMSTPVICTISPARCVSGCHETARASLSRNPR